MFETMMCPQTISPAALSACLAENLSAVRARIKRACEAAGRAEGDVRLLPVSKTHPVEVIAAAHALNLVELGENKVQEAWEKFNACQALNPTIRWRIIGHLQSNKARVVARFAHAFDALDSVKLAAELDRHLHSNGRSMEILIQINTSAEGSKSGLPPDVRTLVDFLNEIKAMQTLNVRGLMTMAMPLGQDNAQAVRACFAQLRQLRDAAQEATGRILPELSMGMSGDLELAVAEGATLVRVGSALFGARTMPPPAVATSA